MSKPVVDVQKLSKKFKLWETVPEKQIKSLLIKLLKFKKKKSSYSEISILEDIDFKIFPGEFVGVMGRNGIGKSTILRLISGIYAPTAGAVSIRGRVIPLLELGAGFDAELTGHENIYLNASILGYTNAEVDKVLSEIIEFSELGSRINVPVKNYSSGMLVRLGFSIAVHLNFDVLLLDEVLGVGDVGFLEKSTQKIMELNKKGKTILLVTHSPEQVTRYCSRCIVLNERKVVFDGSTEEGIQCYNGLF